MIVAALARGGISRDCFVQQLKVIRLQPLEVRGVPPKLLHDLSAANQKPGAYELIFNRRVDDT